MTLATVVDDVTFPCSGSDGKYSAASCVFGWKFLRGEFLFAKIGKSY